MRAIAAQTADCERRTSRRRTNIRTLRRVQELLTRVEYSGEYHSKIAVRARQGYQWKVHLISSSRPLIRRCWRGARGMPAGGRETRADAS